MAEGAPLIVPAVGMDEHKWVVEADGFASRAARAAGSGTYRSAVPARIAGLVLAIPSDLAADSEEAAAALAGFDAFARGALGPQGAALGPMSSILLRTESTSSSQIENLTVGARQLALAEIGQATSANAAVVVGNVRTMEAALRLAGHLDEDAIKQMQSELISRQPGWEKHAGTYRDQLVWVGASSVSPRGASYVAPQAQLVTRAMADLIDFIGREDMPVVVQAAIAHAQFETIHPFADGNGRTGRALVHAILKNKGLLTTTTAPVSAGLLHDTRRYFDALQAYRAGDARPIVERFADASRYAAHSGSRLVEALSDQLAEARVKMSAVRPQALAWTVLPQLVAQPVINANYLGDTMGMSDSAAQRALRTLTVTGVLEERTGRQRNRVWQHSGILKVLDDYAEQIRRDY